MSGRRRCSTNWNKSWDGKGERQRSYTKYPMYDSPIDSRTSKLGPSILQFSAWFPTRLAVIFGGSPIHKYLRVSRTANAGPRIPHNIHGIGNFAGDFRALSPGEQLSAHTRPRRHRAGPPLGRSRPGERVQESAARNIGPGEIRQLGAVAGVGRPGGCGRDRGRQSFRLRPDGTDAEYAGRPHFIINQQVMLSGAQPPAVFLEAIRQTTGSQSAETRRSPDA